MLNLKYNLFLMFLLFISPFLVLSTNSLFSMWINMELNLIIFIGYIILNNYNIFDSPMKYFLINSFSSSIFILMINLNYYFNNLLIILIMNIMMLIKLGMVPFHMWYIDMMMNLNWFSCFILSSWQKIIPFFILMFIYNFKLILIIMILSGFISIIFGNNLINLKKIMGYSSINHMCWMLLSLMISEILWLLYFLIYLLINLCLMFMMNLLNLLTMMDLYKFYKKIFKYLFMFILMSLSGLPPMLGFLMKWFSIYKFIYELSILMTLILIIYSLMYLYIYIRLFLMIMFMNHMILKFNMWLMEYFFYFKMSFINLIILLSLIGMFMIMYWIIY